MWNLQRESDESLLENIKRKMEIYTLVIDGKTCIVNGQILPDSKIILCNSNEDTVELTCRQRIEKHNKKGSRHASIWKCAKGRRFHYKSVETDRFPSPGETSYSHEKKIKLYLCFKPYISSSQCFKIIIDSKSFCLYIYQHLLYK